MGSNKYIITKIKCWPVFKQDPILANLETNTRAVTLHVFCSNASIFVDFGYDNYFLLSLRKFRSKGNNI